MYKKKEYHPFSSKPIFVTLLKSYISNFAPLIYAVKVWKPLRIAFDMKKSSSHPPFRVTVCEAVVTRQEPIILIKFKLNSINSACNYNNSSNTNFHCTIFSRLNVPGVYFKFDARSRRLMTFAVYSSQRFIRVSTDYF